ncbi:MAG: hypothetical protein JSW39_09345 [Desulfobacterales bacterium]|nr:MAG: hypothetical protein JSW39_09345 [Desulfobacterales bacterium]
MDINFSAPILDSPLCGNNSLGPKVRAHRLGSRTPFPINRVPIRTGYSNKTNNAKLKAFSALSLSGELSAGGRSPLKYKLFHMVKWFEDFYDKETAEVFAGFRGTGTVKGEFLKALEDEDIAIVPVVATQAYPCGLVKAERQPFAKAEDLRSSSKPLFRGVRAPANGRYY